MTIDGSVLFVTIWWSWILYEIVTSVQAGNANMRREAARGQALKCLQRNMTRSLVDGLRAQRGAPKIAWPADDGRHRKRLAP